VQVVIHSAELERAWVAAALSLPKLPQQLRNQVVPLLSWGSFLAISGTIAVLPVAHLVDPVVGLAADVIVAGVAITLLGTEAIAIAREFILFWQAARYAESPQQLDWAATCFANAVARVGVNGVMLLVARKTTSSATMLGARTRWERLISALRLPTEPDKGALWSKIGAERAKEIASLRGRTTLEHTEGYTAFEAVFAREFGSQQDAMTAELWEKVSRRFAQGLQGRVEAYTDLGQLYRGVQNAQLAARFSPERLSPEELRLLPQFTAELEEISELMLKNDRISAVTVFDVAPDGQLHMTHRMERGNVLRATRGVAPVPGQLRIWH
jgi:hypothetical protein